MTAKHKSRNSGGFSLVELQVAVAVLSIAALGIGSKLVQTASHLDALEKRQRTAIRIAADGERATLATIEVLAPTPKLQDDVDVVSLTETELGEWEALVSRR